MTSITLEPLNKYHAEKLFSVLKDEKIYTYIPENPPESVEKLSAKFKRLAEGATTHLSQIWLNFAIYNKNLKEYIGTVQATIYSKDLKASIAYILPSKYWGRGYAQQAVTEMINILISNYKLKMFHAYIDTRNIKSIRLVERLGFKKIGFEKNAGFFKGSNSDEYICYEHRRME
ncbi:GNAT family protein [Bacillus cytotoxicus]|uniref:GNAT family N-acetyltransferase n=1 Tax=Bacillus cereus group sp. BfR-BA-01492 TaxID=2920361 RepID=UPI001F564446|nr:GNAT family protein [Bacillus cereus group sp. BfR-BA-01492]EMA6342917.1 GNAT family N-acetyltransferase [Bacillus cytotoxicus]